MSSLSNNNNDNNDNVYLCNSGSIHLLNGFGCVGTSLDSNFRRPKDTGVNHHTDPGPLNLPNLPELDRSYWCGSRYGLRTTYSYLRSSQARETTGDLLGSRDVTQTQYSNLSSEQPRVLGRCGSELNVPLQRSDNRKPFPLSFKTHKRIKAVIKVDPLPTSD